MTPAQQTQEQDKKAVADKAPAAETFPVSDLPRYAPAIGYDRSLIVGAFHGVAPDKKVSIEAAQKRVAAWLVDSKIEGM